MDSCVVETSEVDEVIDSLNCLPANSLEAGHRRGSVRVESSCSKGGTTAAVVWSMPRSQGGIAGLSHLEPLPSAGQTGMHAR